MDLQEWIDLGVNKGIVTLPEGQQMTFQEVYQKWFLMKLNVIKSQSCDRIECTYNRYYKNSELEQTNISAIDENMIIRFLTKIIVGIGGITTKEFGRIFQVISNVMIYARDLELGGARLLDWHKIRRYVPTGEIIPDVHMDFAIPRDHIEKLLRLVLDENIYPEKRSACLCLLLNFFLGLRVGELAALSWQDIDYEKKVVLVWKTETKTFDRDADGERQGAMVYRVVESTKTIYSVRAVPLLPESLFILERLKEHHDRNGYRSQCLAYDGRNTILSRSLDRTLRRLCALCEITYFNTHCIRKTFATMLHGSGMPTKDISVLLGHSDIGVTEKNYILTYKDNYDELRNGMQSALRFNF